MTDVPNANTDSDQADEQSAVDLASALFDESAPVAEAAPEAPEPATQLADPLPEPAEVPQDEVVAEAEPEVPADVQAIAEELDASEDAPADTEPVPAPETAAVSDTAPAPVDGPISGYTGVSIWPFVAYGLVWAVFLAFTGWQLLGIPSGIAVFEWPAYRYLLLGGLVLTCLGPIVVLITWLATPVHAPNTRWSLFVSALTQGAVATLFGVTLWWIVLIVVDRVRLGALL